MTYFWDPAPGATSYRVDVFNQNGVQVSSTETSTDTTTLTTTVDTFGDGDFFSVQVIALVNGQPACATTSVTLPQEAPGPSVTPEVQAPFCNFNEICETWLGETYPACLDCIPS